MNAGSVGQIWRYPVKSMMGERLDVADLTPTGLLADRGWAARDEERGGIRGAKKIGTLMKLAARYVDAPVAGGPIPQVEITLPDRTTVRTDDADVHTRVSAALQHEVTLWPLQPPTDTDHYRRGPADHDDVVEELRDIFGRTVDEPLPDLSVFPPEIFEFESPPGTYYDAYPLLLLTTASLDALGALTPSSAVDVRRFRPNLLVESGPGQERFVEQDWLGKRVVIGDVELEVVAPCPRCVMVTRGFADLPQDPSVLRAIVREADQNLGVYANVVQPGRIAIGDGVEVA